MDEESEHHEEAEYEDNSEFEIEEDAESITEVPPAEGAFGKYLREYRLLNSLLLSLGIIVGIIGFMLAWTIVVQVGEEGILTLEKPATRCPTTTAGTKTNAKTDAASEKSDSILEI